MYDPRYLAGVVLFNRGDFFEAHEAWEALWMDTAGEEKKFIQGLIPSAPSHDSRTLCAELGYRSENKSSVQTSQKGPFF